MHAITGTSESWAPQIDAFARAGYRVIAFDRRGWGRSETDAATGAQPGHAADDLHALADHFALGRFHLVGVAGGGFVALDYAAAHPERLASLVVGASTGSVSDTEIQDVIARIEIPGDPGRFPLIFERWALRIAAPIPRARSAGSRSKSTHDRPARRPSRCDRRTRYAKLATITTRTLVVAADADLLAPPGLMKLWARHVKGAQWTTVPDAGHSIAWEQPAIFNDIVLKFSERGRPFGDVPQ